MLAKSSLYDRHAPDDSLDNLLLSLLSDDPLITRNVFYHMELFIENR